MPPLWLVHRLPHSLHSLHCALFSFPLLMIKIHISLKMHVYFGIHEKQPSNGMIVKINRPQANGRIRKVDTEIIGVYSSFDAAKAKAHYHISMKSRVRVH